MGKSTHSSECYKWHPECAAAEVQRLREKTIKLEGTMQTAIDLLVESKAEAQSYDFDARRDLFIELEIELRRKVGRE